MATSRNQRLVAGALKKKSCDLTDPRFVHTPSEENIAEAMKGNQFLTIGDMYPVLFVSYQDAQSYVEWLNTKLDTNAYRLPTEAEWEYAARAGTDTRFAPGNDLTSAQANFSGEMTAKFLIEERPDLRTRGFLVPVDELEAANGWGLRHMSGNVSEITLSCYTPHLPVWTMTSEWLTESISDECDRSIRGGSYAFPIDTVRVAWRGRTSETNNSSFKGFRILKDLR